MQKLNSRIKCIVIGVLLNLAGPVRGEPGTPFSSLPQEKQQAIRKMVEPPPLAQRTGCYSTPMYYLMYKGYKYEGTLDKQGENRTYIKDKNKPGHDWGTWALDQNRPDWQEVMVRDWAELGLNNTHLNIYPIDNTLDLSPEYLKAIQDFAALSEKHGLKVGVRLDPLGGTTVWELHPNNPENQLKPYLAWVKQIAELMKGKTAYYVLGDELTLHEPAPDLAPEKWTPAQYLEYFKQVSAVIKQADPTAKVSMFAASSGEWFNVLYMLKHGYAQYGDAVAINFYDYGKIPSFFDDARKLAPGLLFLSNGVGYSSCGPASPRYPEGDPYSKLPTEEAHANAIAKNMFAWWDLGAATAPYYISLRNWVKEGQVYPRWFGFFGFEDYVIEKDNFSVKRYPGWYAFQTITHTFYNRDQFKDPGFEVTSSQPLGMFRVYEHQTGEGSELLLMLWNDKASVKTTIQIKSSNYQYPVSVSALDYKKWNDIPYELTSTGAQFDVDASRDLTIVRLVQQK